MAGRFWPVSLLRCMMSIVQGLSVPLLLDQEPSWSRWSHSGSVAWPSQPAGGKVCSCVCRLCLPVPSCHRAGSRGCGSTMGLGSAGALLLPLMVLVCFTHFACFTLYLKKNKTTKPVPFPLTNSVQAADPWLSCVQEVLLQDSTKTHFPEGSVCSSSLRLAL